MWNVLKFVIISLLISSARSAEVESMENTFNCYTDYLKRHGVIEQSFESEPFNGESALCEIVLSTTVEGVYSALFDEFNKSEELNEHAGCIVENLRKMRWSDLDLKEQIYRISDALTENETDEKIREIKSLQSKISNEAIISCMAQKEFGELFDQIFRKDEQEDYVGDYCARKYALENKLVNSEIYKVNPNPNNIITEEVKCDEIVKQQLAQAEEELKQHLLKNFDGNADKVNCFNRKYHENNYFNITLAVELLGELEITQDQKLLEKNKFIQIMTRISKSLAEC